MLADPDALVREAATKPPILLVHGDADEVLPVTAMYQAKTRLEALGFEVATHVSPNLGHSVDETGLQLGASFLASRLA
jgi:phospholipase/carboxylesterase